MSHALKWLRLVWKLGHGANLAKQLQEHNPHYAQVTLVQHICL